MKTIKTIMDVPKDLYAMWMARGLSLGTPLNEVLDKIRAEIADLDDADYDYEGYYKAVTDAVKIIDKYREESE